MSGSTQPRQASFGATRPDSDASKPEERVSSPPRRDSLMHPTALPLGFALGCCLGLVMALIAFF